MPHLTRYMRRMAVDGYGGEYCRGVKAALARYNEKVAVDESGERPLNRPPGYQWEEGHKVKKAKRKYWATRGSYVAPVIITSKYDVTYFVDILHINIRKLSKYPQGQKLKFCSFKIFAFDSLL